MSDLMRLSLLAPAVRAAGYVLPPQLADARKLRDAVTAGRIPGVLVGQVWHVPADVDAVADQLGLQRAKHAA